MLDYFSFVETQVDLSYCHLFLICAALTPGLALLLK